MRLFYALPASIAALLLAACAAFSSADSPDDDGSAPTSDDSASPESGGGTGTSDGGASDSGQAGDGATDGGGGYGNDATDYVRCGDSLPDCNTKSDGSVFPLCCAPAMGEPSCVVLNRAYCAVPVTIRCDGPEDCGGAQKCRPQFPTAPGEPRVTFECASGDLALAACHDDGDCAGSDLKCRRLTCGAVVLGVCAGPSSWPDAGPCTLD